MVEDLAVLVVDCAVAVLDGVVVVVRTSVDVSGGVATVVVELVLEREVVVDFVGPDDVVVVVVPGVVVRKSIRGNPNPKSYAVSSEVSGAEIC